MKIARIRAISAGIVLLLIFCTAGCGSQSGETVQHGSAMEQNTGTELPVESAVEDSAESTTEDLKDSSIESTTDEPMETTAGETEGGNISMSSSEMTVAERISTLTIEGQPFSVPCRVGDMGEGFRLGNGVSIEDITTCALYYGDTEVGEVRIFKRLIPTEYQLEDMSTGYEDEEIFDVTLYGFSGDYEIAGVTPDFTLEEVIDQWDEPNEKTEHHLTYYDTNEETGGKDAYIRLDFYDRHPMDLWLYIK